MHVQFLMKILPSLINSKNKIFGILGKKKKKIQQGISFQREYIDKETENEKLFKNLFIGIFN